MLAYKSDSCVLHLLFDLILSFKSLNLDSLLVIFAYTGLDPLLPSEQP